LSQATGISREAAGASSALIAALLRPPLIPTISARQVAGLGVGAIYASLCAQPRPVARAAARWVALVTFAFNRKGLTMERNGCLYIAAVTVAFWAGVAGLILLFI